MSENKESGAPDEPRASEPPAKDPSTDPQDPAPEPEAPSKNDDEGDADEGDADETEGEEKAPSLSAPKDAGADEASESAPLLRRGNPVQLLRGGAMLGTGALIAFLIMAMRAQYRFGVPIAALGILLATFGVLDLVGSFDDPDDRVARRVTFSDLLAPLGIFAGGALALFVFVSLAVSGIIGPVVAAVAIPASFLGAVVGVYRAGERLGVWSPGPDGADLPMYRRHGFWLVTLVTLLYLPLLGSHSLSDPWETHYGEVSREILARNDWISLWWAQDGWFWSKPIFDFWAQALAMATFGVRYQPGQMLSAVAEGRVPWPEWAVRLPIFLITLIAIYLLYKAVARVWGRRAGFLGGVVLTTMPQWFFVSHQTMTDMPFVATMSAAMALVLLGIHEDETREVRVYEVGVGGMRMRLSAYHLVVGTVIACALPQVLYLFSRNLEIGGLAGISFHADAFTSGSPLNCGLPSNEACRPFTPVVRGLQPSLQALLWIQALALVLYLNWGERRAQRLYFLAAWFFAALSTMAKGPAGFGLPVLCAFAYVIVSRRYRDLLRLEIVSGVLLLLAVALPWFVAMYARHGQPFTDRLLFHDMFKRAFTHVHDTNEGDDVGFRFYVWQLGYAMFPWTGLVPAALVHWLKRPEEGDRRSDASIFLAMWFLFAFALFTLMLTKFHHYILPALPPAAMLTGVLLDEMMRRTGAEEAHAAPKPSGMARLGWMALYGVGIGGAALLMLRGFAKLCAPLPFGTVPAPARTSWTLLRAMAAHSGWGVGAILAGAGLFVLTASFVGSRLGGRGAVEEGGEGEASGFVKEYQRILLGAAGAAGGLVVFLVGRDLAGTREGMIDQARLLHLFTYNYKRPFPSSLDFRPTLWAFALVAGVFTFALVSARARRHVVAGLCAVGILFAGWGLDVYFMKTSPHWGQRETMLAYYSEHQKIPGPIIAYQMNWKGENFYTGNTLPVFVSSGKKFQDYILEQKKKGVKTFYFVTEHGRTGSLANELGGPRIFDKLTTPELNNKFGLVRATFE
ncbi:ArnT family glycosyltransferase [Polyangium aurulentum]|uniref:ArnT family glycosyltransferase n=1 Tax=Polyangium aurulentum TaxID=2567896 RepID=UPI001F311D3C|nr:glycosyltransferase family 39 protein [Polyangium aurulentum]